MVVTDSRSWTGTEEVEGEFVDLDGEGGNDGLEDEASDGLSNGLFKWST